MQEDGTGTRAVGIFVPAHPLNPHAVQIPNPRRAISAYHTRAHAGIRYTTILYSSIQYNTIHYYTIQYSTILYTRAHAVTGIDPHPHGNGYGSRGGGNMLETSINKNR